MENNGTSKIKALYVSYVWIENNLNFVSGIYSNKNNTD